MKRKPHFLTALALGAMMLAPAVASASLLRTYDEKTVGIEYDNSNHRMENAFAISDTDFYTANVGDYVDILGWGKLDAVEFGDTYRAYLYAGVTYSVKTNPNQYYPTGTSLANVVQDTTLTVVNGGSVAASGSNFNFATNGYEFVGVNDRGTTGDNILPNSSAFEFTAANDGYYYFFVSHYRTATEPTASSSGYDNSTLGYSSYGDGSGVFGFDADNKELDGGMFYTGSNTPTGSVLGGLTESHYYWLRIEQTAGESPGVNPVPEPSSIAIFSVIGIGGLMLRRRMKAKK